MSVIFNPGQERVIQDALNHIRNPKQQVYEFEGPAGTGKSTTINEILRRSNLSYSDIVPMAYIGQAAIVMRTHGLINAKTIHSSIFDIQRDVLTDRDGNVIMNHQFNTPELGLVFVPKDLTGKKLMFIDEGRTVPFGLKYEIERRGIPMIVSGDARQLPPVGDRPAYICRDDIGHLTEIMRQNQDSPILYIADRAYRGLPIQPGLYGNRVLVIEEKDLTNKMLMNSDMVICAKNTTREHYNKRIREDIYHIDNPLPQFGERVICRKNNWLIELGDIALANGLIGTVISHQTVNKFNGKTFFIDFKPDLLNAYFKDLELDYKYFTALPDDRKMLKNSKYSKGNKFEFAYCITTHLSQGAQYQKGIYISEHMHRDIQPNLDYTGATRFSDFLIYVIPTIKKRFYINNLGY